MRNDLVREAINRLSAKPDDARRIDLYRKLTDGLLLVVVADLPAELDMRGTPLDKDTNLSMLTTSVPNGGEAIIAFTDIESLQSHAPGARHIAMRSQDLLKLVIDGGYDALIVNPDGPWVGVPRDDIQRILDGVWSATDT